MSKSTATDFLGMLINMMSAVVSFLGETIKAAYNDIVDWRTMLATFLFGFAVSLWAGGPITAVIVGGFALTGIWMVTGFALNIVARTVVGAFQHFFGKKESVIDLNQPHVRGFAEAQQNNPAARAAGAL